MDKITDFLDNHPQNLRKITFNLHLTIWRGVIIWKKTEGIVMVLDLRTEEIYVIKDYDIPTFKKKLNHARRNGHRLYGTPTVHYLPRKGFLHLQAAIKDKEEEFFA